MPMDEIVLITSTKNLRYISESIPSTLPRVIGALVNRFLEICPPIGATHQIVLGDFSPGVQIWRDVHGRAVVGSWSNSSGWDLPNGPKNRFQGGLI